MKVSSRVKTPGANPPKRKNSNERLRFIDDWLTEVKFDGWRCHLVTDNAGARVFNRRGFDWTDKLKIIADAAATELKVTSAIIDGELVYPHSPACPTSTLCRQWLGHSRTSWCSWHSICSIMTASIYVLRWYRNSVREDGAPATRWAPGASAATPRPCGKCALRLDEVKSTHILP
jgi:hypothetical protein